VSSQAPSLPVSRTVDRDRSRLMIRAKTLSWLSIGWMTIEATAAIVAALIAGSVALLGFGLDSLIELASASTILWLYTGTRRDSDTSERRAQQIIAGCFATLAIYLTFDSISALTGDRHPDTSWLGVVVAIGAIVFMPALARGQGSRCREARLCADCRGCRTVMAVRDQRRRRTSQHRC
jgi:divalent metal cation (Fe/Co/Zn/Cd) transporter